MTEMLILSVNQVPVEASMEYQWSVYQWLIEGIDWHSTVDAFSAHDLTIDFALLAKVSSDYMIYM